MMKNFGMGLIGPGFIATHHVDAVRRLGDVDVIAIAGSTQQSAERKAAALHIPLAYGRYEDLLKDPDIHVIHNTTPNHLHFEITRAALLAGKHVISDKPLAQSPAECAVLRDLAREAGVVNAVTFNYRGSAMVQEMRQRVADDALGEPRFLHGHYLQDWLTDPAVYSWRMDPAKGGRSSALADIGSHWCDLVEYVSGLRIEAVLAELTTVVKTRYSGSERAEAFSVDRSAGQQSISIASEDLGCVLLRFSNGARGSLIVGQVLPGHKNDLRLEISGSRLSMRWEQEAQNQLWIGSHTAANAVLEKDPGLLSPAARAYAHLPGGHQEGWADAFRNVIADAYTWVRAQGDAASKPATVCSFAGGYRVACIIEAMLRSQEQGGVWTAVE